MSLDDATALALYRRVWPEDDDAGKDVYRDKYIAAEVREMLAAPSDKAAFLVVEWWYNDESILRRRVKRLRAIAARGGA